MVAVISSGRKRLLGVEALHGMLVVAVLLLLLLLQLHLLLPLLHYFLQRRPLVVVEGHLVLRLRDLVLRVVRGGVGVLVAQPGVRPHHGLHHAPLVDVRRQRRNHSSTGRSGRRRRGRRVVGRRRRGRAGEDRLGHLVLKVVPLNRRLVHPLRDVHRQERPRRRAESVVAAVVHRERHLLMVMMLLGRDDHRCGRRPRARARRDERLVLAGGSLG